MYMKKKKKGLKGNTYVIDLQRSSKWARRASQHLPSPTVCACVVLYIHTCVMMHPTTAHIRFRTTQHPLRYLTPGANIAGYNSRWDAIRKRIVSDFPRFFFFFFFSPKKGPTNVFFSGNCTDYIKYRFQIPDSRNASQFRDAYIFLFFFFFFLLLCTYMRHEHKLHARARHACMLLFCSAHGMEMKMVRCGCWLFAASTRTKRCPSHLTCACVRIHSSPVANTG